MSLCHQGNRTLRMAEEPQLGRTQLMIYTAAPLNLCPPRRSRSMVFAQVTMRAMRSQYLITSPVATSRAANKDVVPWH